LRKYKKDEDDSSSFFTVSPFLFSNSIPESKENCGRPCTVRRRPGKAHRMLKISSSVRFKIQKNIEKKKKFEKALDRGGKIVYNLKR
jgi:hypothetical protein